MRCALIGLIVCLVSGCLPASGWAQTPRANGPFANLFGASSSATHALDFHGYLFEAYQQDLLPPEEEAVAVLDPSYQKSQTFGGATGTLDYRYNRRGDHSFIRVNGYGALADYSIHPEVPQYTANASATTGVFGHLTPKIRGDASLGVSYSPYFGYAPFSPLAGTTQLGTTQQALVGPQYGFPTALASNIPLTATAQLTDQLSRRSTLAASATWSKLFVLSDASRGYEARTGQLRYTRQIRRRLSIYGGYMYSESRFADSDQVARNHGADGGVSYGDSLTVQLGRRTSASFAGSVTGAGSTNATRGGSTTRYAATGSASIHHGMGRTWSAMAAYNRSFGFIAFFDQPVLSNTVVGSIAGQLAPRVNWNTSVGWMRGEVGFGDRNGLGASYATSMATLAIARNVGLYAQYTYYNYELPMGPYTRFLVRTSSARQIAMVGLTLFAPIFHHDTRSPSDTR